MAESVILPSQEEIDSVYSVLRRLDYGYIAPVLEADITEPEPVIRLVVSTNSR